MALLLVSVSAVPQFGRPKMHELAASVGNYPTSADPATGLSVNAAEVVTSTASGSGAVVTSTESGYAVTNAAGSSRYATSGMTGIPLGVAVGFVYFLL